MPRPDDEYDDDRPRRRPDDTDDLDRRAGRDDRAPWPDRPRKRGMSPVIILLIVGVVVLLCGGCVVGGLFFGVGATRDAANRMKSANNLKQIGLAIHNYHDTDGELPGNTYGPDGKPLLSWRVHLLPYIEQDMLYRQFKLDEPWDSPHNRPLLQQMPAVYHIPSQPPGTPAGFTHYRGFSSPGAVFDRKIVPNRRRPPDEQFTLMAFRDTASMTVLVVEAADPVEWTKPDDLDASPNKPFPKMGNFYRRSKFQVLLGDGRVLALPGDTPETTLRALVTHSGGEPLPADWDQ